MTITDGNSLHVQLRLFRIWRVEWKTVRKESLCRHRCGVAFAKVRKAELYLTYSFRFNINFLSCLFLGLVMASVRKTSFSMDRVSEQCQLLIWRVAMKSAPWCFIQLSCRACELLFPTQNAPGSSMSFPASIKCRKSHHQRW